MMIFMFSPNIFNFDSSNYQTTNEWIVPILQQVREEHLLISLLDQQFWNQYLVKLIWYIDTHWHTKWHEYKKKIKCRFNIRGTYVEEM